MGVGHKGEPKSNRPQIPIVENHTCKSCLVGDSIAGYEVVLEMSFNKNIRQHISVIANSRDEAIRLAKESVADDSPILYDIKKVNNGVILKTSTYYG